MMYRVAITLLLLAVAGCSSTGPRGEWGGSATLHPAWSTVKQAAYRAASDPKTWAPLSAAVLLHAGGQDERLSRWASEQRPLFGDEAESQSDALRRASDIAYAATVLLAPSGDEPLDWLANKAKGVAVGGASFATVGAITDSLKEQSARLRPNGENRRSFISGHTSHSASRIALAMHNLDYIAMPDSVRSGSNIALYSIAAGTAWARVEAEKHYPSDVLAALAVGNFVTTLFNDTFLQPATGNALLSIWPGEAGAEIVFSLAF